MRVYGTPLRAILSSALDHQPSASARNAQVRYSAPWVNATPAGHAKRTGTAVTTPVSEQLVQQ
eukprot:scaffold5540_cov390-Prasinococcus_capsulatus_cf.AAC.15